MVIVCQHCGVKGFEEALTLCEKCGQHALHRYCLEALPKDLSEDIIWFCEDCKPYNSKQSILDKPSSPSSVFSVSVDVESPESTSRLMKNERVITSTKAKTEVQRDEGRPSGNEPRSSEKHNKDQMLQRKRRLFLEDEEVQHLQTSQVAVINFQSSNIVVQRVITCSVAKTEGQVCEGKPFGNDSKLRKKCDNDQYLEAFQASASNSGSSNIIEERFCTCSVAKTMSQCGDPKCSNVSQHKIVVGSMEKRKLHLLDVRPSGNMPKSKERCDNDKKLTKKGKLLLSDKEAESVKTSEVISSHPKPSNTLPQKGVTGSVTKTKVQTCDSSPSSKEQQCREKCDQHQKLSKRRKTSEVGDSKPLNISQQKDVIGSASKTKVQLRDSWPFSGEQQHRSKYNKHQNLGKERKTSKVGHPRPLNISQQKASASYVAKAKLKINDGRPYPYDRRSYYLHPRSYDGPYCIEPRHRGKNEKDRDSRHYRSEPLYIGKYDKGLEFGKRQRLLFEDDEEVETMKIYQADTSDRKLSNVLEQIYYLEAQPIIDRIWKGSLRIWNKDFKTPDRLLVNAHLSNLACPRVFEVAKLLPEVIALELSNRSHFWPRSFHNCGPSYHHIALFFFPNDKRDENVFDSLVSDMIDQDLAMKAVFEEAELLVFTSYALPVSHMRFQTKHYLWGVFLRRQA